MELNNRNTMMRELPASERPRERLVMYGPGALSNAELLAILIASGTRSMSAEDLARNVLAQCREGISGLGSLSFEELSSVNGIGPAKACSILAAAEIGRRAASAKAAKKTSMTSSVEAAAAFMDELRGLKKEHFCIALLNVKNELIVKETISVGGLNSSPAHPREVFAPAVKRGAHAVILAHNHPSGDPAPSREDIDLTNRLVKAGKTLGIVVLDHIIIGDGSYASFRDMGYIRP